VGGEDFPLRGVLKPLRVKSVRPEGVEMERRGGEDRRLYAGAPYVSRGILGKGK